MALEETQHLSDQELVLSADSELSAARAARVAEHVSQCGRCQVRKQALEQAAADSASLYRDQLDSRLPSAAGPRALLKARLAEVASAASPMTRGWSAEAPWLLALVLIAVLVTGYRYEPASHAVPVSFPEPSLTPGAVATDNREQVCRSAQPKNRAVPVALQRKIFAEYGISGAEPRAYEVDYLITPALGGADDIRNLWPQSNSSAVWNAQVKDALEDHLHKLVCEGNLDLVAAQKDISSDWIAAYRKYFHTDQPLRADH
jgi:hypothetical protein